MSKLQDRYDITDSDVIQLLQKKIIIPITIFSHKTSPLESLVKYLKENYNLKLSQIALLLNRDHRTIWITYDSAYKKIKEPFSKKKRDYFIDIEKFSNRRISVLEIVCNHLTELGFSITQISSLLNKHRNTIWSVLSRYKKKNG